MFVKLNPVGNHPVDVLQDFEPMPTHTLLLTRAHHPLNHAVLLWTVRREELLPQPIATHRRGVIATRQN
jgi:hypothetical protein